MSSCYACSRSLPSIRCLLCQEYFCLTCSGTHRHQHLLDAFDDRLADQINSLQLKFDEKFFAQYRQTSHHLQIWINDLRRQLKETIQYQLDSFLRTQFELMKVKTDDYIQEYLDQFVNLHSNVRYVRQRQIMNMN